METDLALDDAKLVAIRTGIDLATLAYGPTGPLTIGAFRNRDLLVDQSLVVAPGNSRAYYDGLWAGGSEAAAWENSNSIQFNIGLMEERNVRPLEFTKTTMHEMLHLQTLAPLRGRSPKDR